MKLNTKSFYHIPSGIPKEVCEIIKNTCYEDDTIEDSVVFPNKIIDTKIRKSKSLWLPTDGWIAGMLSHFIYHSNFNFFHYDLHQWADRIQYTVYEGKGSHYDWHYDTALSSFYENSIRKLSITMMLSEKDEYEGGEFQLMLSPKDMKTFDLNLGDVIIFPSELMHRVRPLKSGTRTTLVGWFGGPPLR
jgi:PKHD-type hydroxylase